MHLRSVPGGAGKPYVTVKAKPAPRIAVGTDNNDQGEMDV